MADGPRHSAVAIGFLGTGLIADFHARNLGASPEADIVACFDIDSSRAASFAQRYGCRVAGSADEVIAAADAVYVCTWTSAHADLVAAVAAADKAVFCEKPLAVDFASARAITDTVVAAGVVNQVGLVLRRSPAFRWLHHLMTRPGVGDLMTIVFRDDQYLPIQGMYGSTWRADKDKAGAGTLLEHSIHDLDLLRWMMGPIETVSATTANHHGHDGIEDLAVASLTTAGGATATLTSIWHDLLDRPSQRRVEVFCTNGYFTLEGDWNGPVRWETADSTGELSGAELAEAAHGADGLGTNPDVAFVEAVADRQEAHPDFATAIEAHRICDAAYRSAANAGTPENL